MTGEANASTTIGKGGLRAWIVWSLSAAAFGYAFFQRVAPSVMVSDLMREFALGGAILGQLSALYFYPYAALQIPIGALLDRFGARKLLTVALAAAGIGSLVFGSAETLGQAYLGRFLIGAGSAVGFIGSLALASRWFPPHRFAFLAGLAMLFAMVCGIAGQAPLAALTEVFGWRSTMIAAGVFAAVLAAAILAIVRDAPAGQDTGGPEPAAGWAELGRGLAATARNGEVWRIGTAAMAMSGPMLAFGGLWGVPFLMEGYALDKPVAASISSLSLLGWAAGAPFGGWLADRIGLRKLPLLVASGINTGLIAMLVWLPGLSLWPVAAVIFLMGVSGGSMVNCFAMAREVTPARVHGTVTGLVNGLTVAAGGLLQPVIGLLLDMRWTGATLDGARVYQAADYRFAFLSLLAWAAMGFLACLTLRETRCRPLVSGP